MLQDCASETHVELRTDSFPTDLKVIGDPTALRQAFSNLFRNSAEAVRDGESPVVAVSASSSQAGVRLTVSDNGTRIPNDQLPRSFIPFFTTKAKGTGLGLALVHRIIAEHGGTVTVSSGPSGTTFTLRFPPSDMSEKHGSPASSSG